MVETTRAERNQAEQDLMAFAGHGNMVRVHTTKEEPAFLNEAAQRVDGFDPKAVVTAGPEAAAEPSQPNTRQREVGIGPMDAPTPVSFDPATHELRMSGNAAVVVNRETGRIDNDPEIEDGYAVVPISGQPRFVVDGSAQPNRTAALEAKNGEPEHRDEHTGPGM